MSIVAIPLIVRAPEERNVYAICIMDGCFQFLAPAGRHVYSTRDAQKS